MKKVRQEEQKKSKKRLLVCKRKNTRVLTVSLAFVPGRDTRLNLSHGARSTGAEQQG